MSNKATLIGSIQDVKGSTVSVVLNDSAFSGLSFVDGHGYRVGQIGSFVRIPLGYNELYGIVSKVGASAVPEIEAKEHPYGNKWMTIQLVGEGFSSGKFQRGISQYPTIGDEVHLVSEADLSKIYGDTNEGYFARVGCIAGAESIPALLDVNKLITRHVAVVGTTGSGKSTTVASLINALSDEKKYPSARIFIFDIHGEYGKAFKDKANVYKINPNIENGERDLVIPFWALNFEELCQICFSGLSEEKSKHAIMERILLEKINTLKKYPRNGVNQDSLDIDAPIPFSLKKLWYQLYEETFSTYYSGRKIDRKDKSSWAYEEDLDSNPIIGDWKKGLPPRFKSIDTAKETEPKDKINYTNISSVPNLGSHLESLGSMLRLPRYNFLFSPNTMEPEDDGKVDNDIGDLIYDWVGCEKTITVLDLSGVPSTILNTVVGAISRILYDSLFWGRNLSQGGKQRPLLLVLEEAHNYLNKNTNSFASKEIQRVVKEGRKYGIGAMIVSQRPSEINSTVLSQCGTVVAMRLSNSTDRGHVSGALSDNLEGLTDMLPILRTGEAIILGESVKLPMRTLIQAPSKSKRPDSQDPIVFDVEKNPEENSFEIGGWGIPMEKSPNYDEIVEAWRSQNPVIQRVLKNEKK